MERARNEMLSGPGSPPQLAEWRMWEQNWINVSQQLNQWDALLEYGSTPKGTFGETSLRDVSAGNQLARLALCRLIRFTRVRLLVILIIPPIAR